MELNRHFSNEEIKMDNKYRKKMFNSLSHQENTNQKYIEVPPQ
jgi:hypothetical protein